MYRDAAGLKPCYMVARGIPDVRERAFPAETTVTEADGSSAREMFHRQDRQDGHEEATERARGPRDSPTALAVPSSERCSHRPPRLADRVEPRTLAHPAKPVFHCDRCGAEMLDVHCKLSCRACGFVRDCSDP